ncbi:MAG: two-component regulator propeller domain-containing protein [Verrucomicrobiota bacterium]|nr:hypothetical protein [Verrucomicrobiota bacterium]MCC6823094.1 hypothetical protein [Limisphaerales bacterium]
MPNSGRALILAGLLLGRLDFATAGAPAPAYIVDPAPSGLPQSSVIAMAQARDGYLWLGTLNGLARFDGNRFQVFTEWNTPGLNSSKIVRLLADRQGGLWVGTGGGGANFIKDGRVSKLDLGGDGPGGEIASICEDTTGAVWLYTADGRLARCRDGMVEFVGVPPTGFSVCRAVIAEPSGQVWVGADTNLFRVVSDASSPASGLLLKSNALPGKLDFLLASRQGGFWQFANDRILKRQTNIVERDFGAYPWATNRIMSALEDHEGHLVVGTQNGGVFRWDADGQSHRVLGLSHDTALSLGEDREGNLWVGTDGGGLNRVKRNPFSVAEAARSNVVQSTSVDANGGMWLGFNGGGARYWKDGSWQDYGVEQGLGPNFSSVLVDRQQRVWVGTRAAGLFPSVAGLFQFVGGRFQPVADVRLLGRNISALYQDRSGRIWVGTDAGLGCWDEHEWRWFDQASGMTGNEITAIADDAEGNLWFGTVRAGLNRWRDGKFTSFPPTNGPPCANVTSLCLDRDGALWVGTGNGLGRYQAGRWDRFTTRDGLTTDSINYLIEDDQDNLWIGSYAGLMRIARKSLTNSVLDRTVNLACRAYGPGDGLPTSECTQGSQPAACRTRDGQLWFPTTHGLVTVNPAQLLPNTNVPPVAIESVLLDDKEQNTNVLHANWARDIIVPAGNERLDIHFTSLSLGAPERARFKYRMEGFETKWKEAGGWREREARYPKLPAGRYRFQVTACNEDGVWNPKPATVAILVLPPFWQEWWFITIAGLLLLGAVVGIVHFISTQKLQRQLAELKQQEALEKERARIARDLHDQLGANLTQVALLGEMAETDKHLPDEIEGHAKQISQTARETSRALDEIVWSANPSNDTLEGLINYACKYAQDYLELAGVRYRLEAPAQLPAQNIAPDLRHNIFLAFKESVNNVVKHAQASEVKIRLRLEATTFTLEIEDNGRGPGEAATKTGRNGLRNMRKRMEDVGGAFEMRPGPQSGTLIRLTAPVGKH